MVFPEDFQQTPYLECPSCGKKQFKVIESRLTGQHRRRRKRCLCGYAQTTYEVTQEYFKDAENASAVLEQFRKLLGVSSFQNTTFSVESEKSCEDCVHMLRAGCAFDFPEAGTSYASECIHFESTNDD